MRLSHMDGPAPVRMDDGLITERLLWLLRLRWLVVPVFVAVDLANDLFATRRAPWTALAVGGALLAANLLYAVFHARRISPAALLRWVRFESAVVIAIPIAVAVVHGEPAGPLRYGVLVGVLGAAAVLPRTAEVAAFGALAVVALVAGDAVAAGLDPSRIEPALVARWSMEAGIVVTVTILAAFLHRGRELAAQRLRATADALERARADWDAAFDGIHDLVFVVDRDGRILRCNRAFAKALAARPHELTGRRAAELLAGHPDSWWGPAGDGIVEIDDPVFDTLFEVISTRIEDRVVRVARDVGEQRRLYARLVHADKLAAVGVLATGAAHEINNPTAFVTSNLTELRRYIAVYESALTELAGIAMQAGAAERARGLLGRPDVAFARREANASVAESLQGMERIREIVTNLRSLARRDQAGEPAAPVELSDVIQSVVRSARSDLRTASARIDLRGPVWVLGHRGELVDVILNLVVNAVQAREDGRQNRVSVELTREGPHAVVRVTDTGQGISPGHMKRLFESFFTTKAPGEGTGLGLSLARRIVLAHGGSIDVASELGIGSTFTVRLPALEADAVPSVAPARRAPGAA